MIKKLQLLLIFIVFISFIDFSYSQNQNQIKINVVYLSGDVKIDNAAVKLNQSVLVNQKIQTGADGHIYLKSADNGFLVLRPNSTAFIRAYSVDAKNPQNNRIKIELQNGVSRHISGEAVKAARQNFRFNTPVAAIGVRGTDFVVFTNIKESRIAVNSGGIAISPFTATCQADGFGACQGKSVMELFANPDGNSQISKILEVSANDRIPRLLENISDKRLQINEQENQNIENAIIDSNSNNNSNNSANPVENSLDNSANNNQSSNKAESEKINENTNKESQATAGNVETTENSEISENSKKNNQNLAENSQNSQNSQSSQTTQQNNNSTAEQTSANNTDNSNSESLIPAKVENAVEATKSTIHWGRWQSIAEDKPAQLDLQNINKDEVDFIANNDYFAIFRDKGEWQKPLNDLQFSLQNSEAILKERNGNISPAFVKNGNLNIDIAKEKFSTNLAVEYTLSDQSKTHIQHFKAAGDLSDTGRFGSVAGFNSSTMATSGALSHDNSQAAYIFNGRTFSNPAAPNNQIFGVTQWGITK